MTMLFPGSRREQIGSKTRARDAFTILELLVVMTIISVLLVVLVPAVTSISKSNARKGALGTLSGVLEQARATAIRDGQATYVAFVDQLPNSSDAAKTQQYCYRSFAIFEDDATTPGTVKQITPWKSFPTGVSIRSGTLNNLANTPTKFPFTPTNSPGASFPFLKFNSNGEVDESTSRNPSTSTTPIPLDIFEGTVTGGSDFDTNSAKLTDTIAVSKLTGRAQAVVGATPKP